MFAVSIEMTALMQIYFQRTACGVRNDNGSLRVFTRQHVWYQPVHETREGRNSGRRRQQYTIDVLSVYCVTWRG